MLITYVLRTAGSFWNYEHPLTFFRLYDYKSINETYTCWHAQESFVLPIFLPFPLSPPFPHLLLLYHLPSPPHSPLRPGERKNIFLYFFTKHNIKFFSYYSKPRCKTETVHVQNIFLMQSNFLTSHSCMLDGHSKRLN